MTSCSLHCEKPVTIASARLSVFLLRHCHYSHTTDMDAAEMVISVLVLLRSTTNPKQDLNVESEHADTMLTKLRS